MRHNIKVKTTDKKIKPAQLSSELIAAGFDKVEACTYYGKGNVVVHATHEYSAAELQSVVDAHSAEGERDYRKEYAEATTDSERQDVMASKVGLK